MPLWCNIASTSVVLPWSTWAMMAMLRMSVRRVIGACMNRPPYQAGCFRARRTRSAVGRRLARARRPTMPALLRDLDAQLVFAEGPGPVGDLEDHLVDARLVEGVGDRLSGRLCAVVAEVPRVERVGHVRRRVGHAP